MTTGFSTVQPRFRKFYFGFFKNEKGEEVWTRIKITKKNQVTQEEVRHKKAIRSVLARAHTKVPLLFNRINFILLIPEQDIKGVPRASRGRFYEK